MNEPRILIVEDDPIVAAVLIERLKEMGYQSVGQAASGDQAIALAAELRPALVLMDIQIEGEICLLYTSPSPRDRTRSRMPSSA